MAEQPRQVSQAPEAGEAVDAYRQGVNRGDPEAAVNLGGALEQLGHLKEAADAYRLGIERGDPEAAVRLGGVLEQLDLPQDAVGAFALGVERGDPEAAVRLGQVLERLGRLGEAVDAYGQGLERGDPEAAVRLGGVLERLGRRGEAVDAYRLGIERGDPEAGVKLDAALQHLQRAGALVRDASVRATGASERAVFISYRRELAGGYAGWLSSELEREFGSDRVFRDMDTLEPGRDFLEAIEQALRSCRVMLVLIAPGWVTVEDEQGKPRLKDPQDVLRMEIDAALKRPNVRVTPVLLQGATMPTAGDLPSELEPLSRRNALELSDSRRGFDIGRIKKHVADVLSEPDKISPDTPTPAEAPDPDEHVVLRLRRALEGPQPWRSLEWLAIEAAISEESALEVLRADEDVRFSRGKGGKTIAGLVSRVGARRS